MVEFIGATRESNGDNTYPWPQGAQVGDLAIMMVVTSSRSLRVRVGVSDVWARAAMHERYYPEAGRFGSRARYHLHYARVADVSEPVVTELGRTTGTLMVFRGTQGVGRVRQATGRVPVSAFGGAAVAYMPTGAQDRPGGVSWLEPAMDVQLTPSGGVRPPLLPGYAISTGGDGPVGPDAGGALVVELLPPRGPSAPEVLSPGDGSEVTNDGDIDFQWSHRAATSGGWQDAYQLRAFDEESGQRFWNASTGMFGTAEVTNASSVQGAGINADHFSSGALVEWQVRTREAADGRWSPWSRTSSFTPVTPGSVNVTGPEPEVSENLSPLVTWESTTPRGVQTAYRVQVSRLGAVVYDSGVQPGDATEYRIPALEWENGAGYQVLVRVQQTGGSWSSWGTRDFTVSWTPPATPQVTAWPDRHGVLAQVEVDPEATFEVELERITPAGLWVPVGRFNASGTVTATDVLAPYGVVTAYRARAVSVLEGMPMRSGWGLSEPVVSTDRHSYLAAARDPLTTWVRLLIQEDGPHVHTRPVAVAYGLGDDRPRVSYGTLRGRSGSMAVHALTQGDARALLGLLHAGEPLTVRWPAEADDGHGFIDAGQLTFDVSDQLDVSRAAQYVLQRRVITVPWVKQRAEITGDSAAPQTHPIEGA